MPEQKYNSETLLAAIETMDRWAEQNGVAAAHSKFGMVISRIRLGKMFAEGKKPDEAEATIMKPIIGQSVDLLEAGIQLAHKVPGGAVDDETAKTVAAVRLLHSWAHDLDQAGGLALRESKLERARHKIDYLGGRLQNLEFGMRNAQTEVGSRSGPSSFAGRSGDAIYAAELKRDEEREK